VVSHCSFNESNLMKITLLVAAAALLTFGSPAFPHHSFAMFDFSKEVVISGPLKDLQWTNPHIHLLLDVPSGSGGAVEWDIEGGTPSTLKRSGWSPNVVRPGEQISIVIHPMKNGSNGGSLVRASRADGTAIGGSGAP